MGKQSDFKKTWQNRLCNMGTARTRARVKLREQKEAGASTQGEAGLMESSQSFDWQLNPKATRHNRKPLRESSGGRRQMRHKTHGRAGQGRAGLEGASGSLPVGACETRNENTASVLHHKRPLMASRSRFFCSFVLLQLNKL